MDNQYIHGRIYKLTSKTFPFFILDLLHRV